MSDVLVYFDLESTGVDPYTDRVVEIAMAREDLGSGQASNVLSTVVNPERPIPVEAFEIHGITDEMVADAPTFAELAEDVEEIIKGATLVGYSSRSFDVPLLDSELRRAGRPGLPRDDFGAIAVPEIDLYRVWQTFEPRTLVSAARRFANTDLEDEAHRAEADAAVLRDVMDGMLQQFLPVSRQRGGLAEKLDLLRKVSAPEEEVDRDGKFVRSEDGVVLFSFGKHKDKPASHFVDYLDWMTRTDFSPDTKAWARRIRRGEESDADRDPPV